MGHTRTSLCRNHWSPQSGTELWKATCLSRWLMGARVTCIQLNWFSSSSNTSFTDIPLSAANPFIPSPWSKKKKNLALIGSQKIEVKFRMQLSCSVSLLSHRLLSSSLLLPSSLCVIKCSACHALTHVLTEQWDKFPELYGTELTRVWLRLSSPNSLLFLFP